MTARREGMVAFDIELREHLVRSRLAGDVQTTPRNTIENCGKLVAGDVRYTFGLSDWRTATVDEALHAIRALCGGNPATAEPDGAGWIDPDATLRGIQVHRDTLTDFVRGGGGAVLLATGHPTGLLPHYQALGRVLQQAGSVLLCPLDDMLVRRHEITGQKRALRFLDGVACLHDGARLLHTHRAVYMEAMLDALGGPDEVDLVVGDHGMAGAAVEAGIPTLSIADVNDPALPLAQVHGKTGGVLAIDDNLAPSRFVPVTRAILGRLAHG